MAVAGRGKPVRKAAARKIAVRKNDAAADAPYTGKHPIMPCDPEQLARVRKACAALPEVEEKIAWGRPSFRAGSGGKLFAMMADGHHGDMRIALWLAAPPGAQALLMEIAGQRAFVPPYVGHKGWIALVLPLNDDEQLAHHLRQAWRLKAPKKLLAKFDA